MSRKNDLVKDRLGRNADAFYEALLEAHEGLTFEQCVRMDTRLILILASQIGIKVGVLHSLSGTMAISETTLKDTMLMLVDEQNKKGGVLGKKLEAVVVDPASDWPLFAEKARELMEKDKVDAVFGCWTSVSRKSVLPVFEELNGLLFYPVQYEGEESPAQRLLHRRRAEPAGDPGRGLPEGRARGRALGAGRHRLRLSAHHQQDPRGLPEAERASPKKTS
jgi:hypothetical protein